MQALSKQTFDGVGVFDSGQALLQALVRESELVIVNSQAMKNGGIQFIQVYRVLGNVVTKVISFSVGDAFFDSASCHPHTKVSGMVVPSIVLPREFSLTVDRSPEFTAKHHQRVLEKSSGF